MLGVGIAIDITQLMVPCIRTCAQSNALNNHLFLYLAVGRDLEHTARVISHGHDANFTIYDC